MAGTVMHLVIADRLLDRLGIDNPALFYCGNLAPDAIMARENYVRFMKTHTHFKDGQKPHEFRIKANQDIYHERFNSFAKTFLIPEDKFYELYLGYVTHMLVDELYILRYYEEFLQKLEREGKYIDDEEFALKFVGDVDLVDWELVRSYRFKLPMPDILRSVKDYEIPGWITSEELENSKSFIIHKNFETEHEAKPLQVTTMEKNYAFIDLCVDRIPGILKDRFGLELT